jgi:hypothetical protein
MAISFLCHKNKLKNGRKIKKNVPLLKNQKAWSCLLSVASTMLCSPISWKLSQILCPTKPKKRAAIVLIPDYPSLPTSFWSATLWSVEQSLEICHAIGCPLSSRGIYHQLLQRQDLYLCTEVDGFHFRQRRLL